MASGGSPIFTLFGVIELKGLDMIGSQIQNFGNAISSIGQALIDNVSKPILDMGEHIIETTMVFDKQMSRVSAVTGATGKDFTMLRTLAQDMGKKTSKSATEAAEAIEYMGLAGWSLTEIQKGLEPVLRASEAGMLDLGLTSDLVTDSMSALGLSVDDLEKYLDIAAAAQNNSNQSMQQFLEAMVTAGGTFKMFNIPLEEAGALLGILANRGFKGSEAGNALTSIMANLTSNTGKAGKAIDDLDIKLYDSNGKFRGMTVILKELNKKFAAMTEEQKNAYIQMIGGKTRTKELNALLNGTADELTDLTDKLHDSDGALNEMAKTMQDNFAGQMTRLESIFEGIAIQIGDILTPFLSALVEILQTVAEIFYDLPSPIKLATVALAAFTAIIPLFVVVAGTAIAILGGLITALGALILVVTTVGLPVFATIGGIIAGIVAQVVILTAVIAGVITAWTLLLAKIGIFSDGLATIKALLSGDVKKVFDLLRDRLGMSEESAKKLSDAFMKMYEKASIVIKVIKDNLGPVMDILKEKIKGLITGGFDKLNGSTLGSHSIFVDFVRGVVKWGTKLFDYLYNVFDKFGLISNELKFANNKIAGEFVDMHGKLEANYDNLLNSQSIFGDKLTKKNYDLYNKKIADTKKLMDEERKVVLDAIDKRKKSELESMTKLFEESKVLSTTEEANKLEKLKEFYVNQETTLKENDARILEIYQTASNQKRELTQVEIAEIERLRTESGLLKAQIISDDEAEQIRILEETKNTKIQIAKDEALAIVVEANTQYDTVIEKAKLQKDEKIKAIIQQRDGTKIISKEEADALIAEATREYKDSVKKAEDTRDETVKAANEKSGGVLTAADLERREISKISEKIKKVITEIWNDLKEDLPKIVAGVWKDVKKVISENKKPIKDEAFKVGAALISGILEGIASLYGRLLAKISIVLLALNPLLGLFASKIVSKVEKHATGVVDSPLGHLAITGEEGPELMWIPKHSTVYTASETKDMLSGTMNKSKNLSSGGSTNNSNVANSYQFTGPITLHLEDLEEMQKAASIINNLRYEKIARGGV